MSDINRFQNYKCNKLDSQYYKEYYSRYYINNFNNESKLLVEEAIRLSGRKDIFIDDEPMSSICPSICSYNYNDYSKFIRPKLMGRYFSIYVVGSNRNTIELSNFWNIYYDLNSSIEWQFQIQLTEWQHFNNEEVI